MTALSRFLNRPWVGYTLAVFALIWLALTWGSFFSPLSRTSFGVAAVPAGANARIVAVRKGSDAEKAGVRTGDVVDLSALSLSDRYRFHLRYSPIGTPLTLRLVRNGQPLTVTVHAQASSTRAPWDFVAANLLNATVMLLIIAVVVARRPSLATAALVLYGLGAPQSFPFTAEFSWLPNPVFGFVAVLLNLVVAQLPLFALLPFIARFPTSPQTPAARRIAVVSDCIYWLAATIFTYQLMFEPLLFASWRAFDVWSTFLPFAIVLLFTGIAYRRTSGEDRRRVGWVLVGLIVAAASYTAFDLLDITRMASGSSLGMWDDLSILFQVTLSVALGYSILRHRVLDIGFALNRTMVYGVMTALVVVVVSGVDWLTSRMLSEERLALALEAAVTIGFGVMLNWLHGRTERLIDRIIFRARHIAEKRIEYRIGALNFAPTPALVDEALAVEAPRIIGLQSAAVFRRELPTQPFTRTAASGWSASDASEIGDDSMLVSTLRSLERPIVLDDVAILDERFPQGYARAVLAIPIVSQHELIGFAMFGNRDDALPDPEEITLLARLCQAAGNAYAMVEARRLREHAAFLERSIADLRSVHA